MSKPDGGPAFPRSGFECSIDEKGSYDSAPQAGMTLRDWFAGQAIVGIMGSLKDEDFDGESRWPFTLQWVPMSAYAMADAMLAARGK